MSRRKYTKGMREILDLVSKIGDLKTSDYDKNVFLWNILTSLRGPDADIKKSRTLKYETTAKLRAVVCPTLSLNVGANVNRDCLEKGNFDDSLCFPDSHHFINHFNNAVRAIQKIYPSKAADE